MCTVFSEVLNLFPGKALTWNMGPQVLEKYLVSKVFTKGPGKVYIFAD